VNLDITSFSSLPGPLICTFATLIKHASSIESNMKKTILEVLKLITEFPHDDDPSPSLSPANSQPSDGVAFSQDRVNEFDNATCIYFSSFYILLFYFCLQILLVYVCFNIF
jgi:hypothetical protein